ncbi:MAG: energy transducer TonB [Vicingaceae bacterium]|nr:energy transducer TonB [Vicingaceae bacterium]
MEIIKDKNSRSGVIGTILVHLLLLLMFLSFGMTYQDPPEPNEGSMMINFGTSDEGSGEVESEEAASSQSENVTPTENNSASAAEEQVLTQNNTEAPVVNSSETQTEETVQEEQSASQSLLDALNAANNANSNSEDGNQGDSGNPGNQGDPNGNPDTHGNSPSGNSIGYSLGNGRGKVSFKKPENPTQKDGTVVVDIWVNRDGKVTKAKAGARGSTTTNPILQKKAEEAAFKAVFKSDANAPFEQKGTMTFVFILN